MSKRKKPLKSPIIWPGGKSRIAHRVWAKFGNVDNYCEPFVGSAAVLLHRPESHFEGRYRVETVNDANHFVCNFWRAVKAEPEAVAEWADNPVLEADLHARHQWLMKSGYAQEWRVKMKTDPEHYDAKIAGWWVWGLACWIGFGWCSDECVDRKKMPQLDAQRSVNASLSQKIPHLANIGQSVNALPNESQPELAEGRVQLADARDVGRGVNASAKLPDKRIRLASEYAVGAGVNGASYLGTCEARIAWLKEWMGRLADRLRLVRTCYGDWSRICDSPSTTTRLGTTGVFLDPPYPTERADTGEKSRDSQLYATDKGADLNALRDDVLAWCKKWGQDPLMRIAVCCYEGDGYEPLLDEGWEIEAWEASGGYSNQRKKKGEKKGDNAKRERIFWSPNCVSENLGLFSFMED